MRGRTLGLLAVVAGLALPVLGQGTGQMRARTSTVELANHAAAPRLPYTAEYKTTSIKTLADGTTITNEWTEVVATDSAGRHLTSTTTIPHEEGKTPWTVSHVSDPVAHTNLSWNSQNQTATLMKMPELGEVRSQCPEASSAIVMPRPAAQALAPHERPTVEDLGTETIQGVEARGRRTTTMTPAGTVGNNEPIVRTREMWTAVDPRLRGILVREVNNDPESGKRTRELTSFTQTEPDLSVFQPPQEYEIVSKDAPAMGCAAFHPAGLPPQPEQ
jgi:hypothetical protein